MMDNRELLLKLQERDQRLWSEFGAMKADLKTAISQGKANNKDINAINQTLKNGLSSDLKIMVKKVDKLSAQCIARENDDRQSKRVPPWMEKTIAVIAILFLARYLIPVEYVKIVLGELRESITYFINIAGGSAGLVAIYNQYQKRKRGKDGK